MNDREIRFIVIAGWGIAVAVVYSFILAREWRSYDRHHDIRSRRDLLAAFGRWIVAMASCLAILGILFGDYVAGIRGALTALALGAFLGAGIVELTDRKPEDET